MITLTKKQQDFMTEFSRLDPGMPRAMGLILGYLLVCEPAEQTSADMQRELDLSAGSISTMLAMLVDSGLVSRTKKPGQRKIYYLITENSWQRTIEMRLKGIENIRNMAEKGLAAADNYRMRELYNVFDFFAAELERMVERLDARRATRP